MTHAEYLRDLRAQARAIGLCGECCVRRAKKDAATCQHCLDRHAKRRNDRIKRSRVRGQTGEFAILNVTDSLYRKIVDIAVRHDRSLSSVLSALLHAALDAAGAPRADEQKEAA